MPTKIDAHNKPLSNVFDKTYAFWIPSYQRPYSWGTEQAELLVQDLLDFQEVKTEDGYFLGSIVVIKPEQQAAAEVIDGQQRLTTLTILIACLAERARELGEDDLGDYLSWLYEKGNKILNVPYKPRLTLREQDKKFFEQYIQGLKIDDLGTLDIVKLNTDAQRNIAKNALFLKKVIRERFTSTDALSGFASFLMNECYLVVVSTPTQESAFRVFSTMNSRGVDLRPTDIIKARVLGEIAAADRDEYALKWESLEEGLGRDRFNELFSHLRTLYRPEKQRGTLLKEFDQYVLSNYSDKSVFIDKVLTPYASAFGDVVEQKFKSSFGSDRVNKAISWLSRVDHADWLPVALHILVTKGEDGFATAELMERLERLASYLLICHVNTSQRISRYGKVVADLAKGLTDALDLSDGEVVNLYKHLDSNIYELSPKRKNYIILRLDSFMSDGGATYDHKMLTIEHVLPQTVASGSGWEIWWPEKEDRDDWVHRLANLVALNRYRNSAAGNRDFKDKIETYLKGNVGVPSYTLTVKMLGATSWMKKDLEARQEQLLRTMLDGWKLPMPRVGNVG